MWIPIESNELHDMANQSISEITDELLGMSISVSHPFELCERALLYAYLSLDHPNECWQEKSIECLNTAIDSLVSSPSIANGLYGGLAGIGWMTEHISSLLLRPEHGIPAASEEDDVLFDVDERLLEQLSCAGTSDLQFDLISGLVGTGVYWLERLPRRKAVRGLMHTLEYLDYTSQRLVTGVTWFTPPPLIHISQKQWAPNGYYNLGVAHGVPGVIAFLAQVASIMEHCDTSQRASELLTASVGWLLMQRRPPKAPSRYSSWLIPGEIGDNSRLAWCYGDLGIAAILHFAGARVGEELWRSEAIEMAYECASRTTHTQVIDAQLCHGALGIAHIFQRFYSATRDEVFRRATMEWAFRGMVFRQTSIGIAGYYTRGSGSTTHQRTNASFLSGAVGIALSLLSLVSPQEPSWDRLMLLSGV